MRKRLVRNIIICVLVCLLTGLFASMATQSSVDTWYHSLNKPPFTPPDWLFAPVWIVLYILMGIAAGIVWSHGFYHKWVKTAMYHFVFQLLLNAMWSIVFFGFKKPLWGFLVILTLLVLIVLTIKWFKVVNRKAAYMLIPYFIWVCFAAILNFEVWRLN
ncbi:tryptophan-rich sensory protein [Zhouia spongiae]|uniref:Tryptophan-rich sensory protein n=1 Tax=Zhouia spongiae TaxID=2202721 RepID=A0ABY3YQL9_9FLAO|nr:TspO/MBR family protein [Zhouia spongiae]UNZ00140.1 tryptophan-rich sensory protein [Zhouia spongiae]